MIQKGPGYHEIDGRKPDAAQAAADEAEQLDFPGGCTQQRKLAAALPDCRGKLTQVVAWRAEKEGKCRSQNSRLPVTLSRNLVDSQGVCAAGKIGPPPAGCARHFWAL